MILPHSRRPESHIRRISSIIPHVRNAASRRTFLIWGQKLAKELEWVDLDTGTHSESLTVV